MPESGSSSTEKMAYQCTERGSAVRIISNVKHFGMRTNGKVVHGEKRYLETSGLSVGFRKTADKPFTRQYTTVAHITAEKWYAYPVLYVLRFYVVTILYYTC